MTPDKNRSGALVPRLWVTRHGAPLPYIRHEFSMRASELVVTEDVIAGARESMDKKRKHRGSCWRRMRITCATWTG